MVSPVLGGAVEMRWNEFLIGVEIAQGIGEGIECLTELSGGSFPMIQLISIGLTMIIMLHNV